MAFINLTVLKVKTEVIAPNYQSHQRTAFCKSVTESCVCHTADYPLKGQGLDDHDPYPAAMIRLHMRIKCKVRATKPPNSQSQVPEMLDLPAVRSGTVQTVNGAD